MLPVELTVKRIMLFSISNYIKEFFFCMQSQCFDEFKTDLFLSFQGDKDQSEVISKTISRYSEVKKEIEQE